MIDLNTVCFGPTNSGKSTLAGYLSSHDLTDKEYAKKVQQFRENYGNDFRERRILSYFLDKGKDEYRDQEGTPGTSKRKHITEAKLENGMSCTLIDTPGTDKRWRSGFQGIYLGDIGIFVIEINTLVDLFTNYIKGSYEYTRVLNRLLIPVSLWEKYGRLDRLVIVISKMDLCEYSRYYLARSERILREEKALKNVPIVPIAIDVKQRSDVNVYSESEKFPNHRSLFSVIKDLMDRVPNVNELTTNNKLCAAIDKRFEKTSSTGEPALRVKVIDGDIKVGTSVMVGPVEYNNQVSFLRGSVRSLMYEANQRQVDILTKNQIGGVVFSRLYNGRDVLNLKEVKPLNTSLIMSSDSSYESGNFLEFTLRENATNNEFFKNASLNDDIKLIWFGKNVVLRIVSFAKKFGYYQLCVMNTVNDNYSFYLPKDTEGKVAYKDFVLQHKDKSDNARFIRVRLHNMVTISNDNRKDVAVCLKTDYRDQLDQNVTGKMDYIEKNDLTVFTIRNVSGIELTKILFGGVIAKTDIVEVAPKKDRNILTAFSS